MENDREALARNLAGRAIADGAKVAETLEALAAGELGDGGPVVLSRREALDAAWEAREEDALAEGLVLLGEARAMSAMVLQDMAGLRDRAAGKVTLSCDHMNRIGRNALNLAKIGKALRAIPVPRSVVPVRAAEDESTRPTSSGASALAEGIAGGEGDVPAVSPLAEQIAKRAQETPALVGANGSSG
jgi:hypothetical protein